MFGIVLKEERYESWYNLRDMVHDGLRMKRHDFIMNNVLML